MQLSVEKRINYQIFGQASSPKLVFLHGIMGQGRNWGSLAKKLAKDFQCLIYDQRGHGRSKAPERFEWGGFSQDLKELLNYLEWTQPIHLVGHSMGGRVALDFANLYPESLEKLVIIDISPSANWESMASILEKLDFVPTPFVSRQEARAFMDHQFLEKFPNKMVKEFFYTNLIDQGGRVDWIFSKSMVRQILETSRYQDEWAAFKSLKCPTLYIRGGDSLDLKESEFTQVLKNNSLIQGCQVEGAGHWVHSEKPLATLKALMTFFNIAAKPKEC